MQVFLETDRLVLRRFTAADVDNLYGSQPVSHGHGQQEPDL